jgi:exodeoxyribonuclease VII large subunit
MQARSPLARADDAPQPFCRSLSATSRLPWRLIENARHRFSRIEGILRVLGPDATLRRGYSITMNDRGQIIRTTAVVRPKMKIRTRVSDGEFGSEVL